VEAPFWGCCAVDEDVLDWGLLLGVAVWSLDGGRADGGGGGRGMGRGKDDLDPFEIESEPEPQCFRVCFFEGPDLEEAV
jgi:hypothetical protein